MPVEYMAYLIGCEIQITTEPNFYDCTHTFVSVVQARTGIAGLFLFADTPHGGRWNLPQRQIPRSTNKMSILDLCGRTTLEVDYR